MAGTIKISTDQVEAIATSIENNNKNNSGNRNTKSAQFKVAFITQAAVIAALYVVLVIMFNY